MPINRNSILNIIRIIQEPTGDKWTTLCEKGA